MMGERSLVALTGFVPSSKTAELSTASFDSAHKKSPQLSGLHGFSVDGAFLTVKINSSPNHRVLQFINILRISAKFLER